MEPDRFDEITNLLSSIIEDYRKQRDTETGRVHGLKLRAQAAFEPVHAFMENLAAALKGVDVAFDLIADGELTEGTMPGTFQRIYKLSKHPLVIDKEVWFLVLNDAQQIEFQGRHFLFSDLRPLETAIKRWVAHTVKSAQELTCDE